MSRRDTIIVAALINAGLLIILFVSALKNPSATETLTQASEPQSQPLSKSIAGADRKTVVGDEVDQVLSQYSKQNPLQPAPVAALSEAPAVEAIQQVATPVAPAQNFVDDLNALTKASEQAASQEITAASSVSSSTPAFVEVKVKKGDVLEKIARSNHISVQELMKINKLSSTSLKIGQILKVPGKSIVKAAASAAAQTQTATDSSLKYYVVKSGDNPWTIAVKNHIKIEDLLRLNNMDEAKARKLKPGDQIRIR